MQIGAILTLSGEKGGLGPSDARLAGKGTVNLAPASVGVLGQNLLERTSAKLREAGVRQPSVVPKGPALSELWPLRSLRSSDSVSAWDKAVAQYLQQGIDTLILLRADFYSEIDFNELLSFHAQRKAAFTQVYAGGGLLDVAVVDAQLLRDHVQLASVAQPGSRQECFYYRGYLNRLRGPADFARLIEDGLYGRCALRPDGVEISPGVWLGDGAVVDPSSVLGSPVFIGKGTRIAPYCTITGGSAIEGDCEIDAGTTIDQSWILSGTYVGLGLKVRRSIVSNQRIFHLERDTEIAITDSKLIGITKSLPLLQTGSLLPSSGLGD